MSVVEVVFALFALVVVGLLVGCGVLLISAARERRQWRGPGLAPDPHRTGVELQDPAGGDAPLGDDGALAAWNLSQFKSHQAGTGTPIPPF